jgi:hypothetical protein
MSLTVDDLRERYLGLVSKSEEQFYQRLNEAESRLQETAKWEWCKTEADLDVVEGCIYLDPTVHAALLGIRVDSGSRVIRPREIEYTPPMGVKTEGGEPGLGHLIDCGRVSVVLVEGQDPVKRRKYRIADLVTGTTVECLLHLAHTTLTHVDDILLCPSSRAIKMAMLAINYEEVDDHERAKAYWADAYQALNEHEATFRGGVRGSLQIQPFGDSIDPVNAIM